MLAHPLDSICIADRQIGLGHKVFIIAEAGVNHNGDLAMAKQLVEVAADAGADAVKFQTFNAEDIVTSEAPKADYQIRTTGREESQLEMLRRLELSPENFRELQTHCRQCGVIFLSTPFDEKSAALLDELSVQAFKISSGDLTNIPLLEWIARTGKPMIVSTGMSNLEEVADAVNVIRLAGCRELVLLHCVTNYPADPGEVNLRAMRTLLETFNVPIGYSDHTQGIEVAFAAVALGACVIEKHFTLDRSLPGPDHRASLTPEELRLMIAGIRKIERALGDGRKLPAASELETAQIARRSLVAARSIPQGVVVERDMIVLKRPGTGMPPAMLNAVIGRRTCRDISGGELLEQAMFE